MSVTIFQKSDRLCFRVRCLPGASRDQVAGTHGDALKVLVAAPPRDGKANNRLVKFLARQLGLAPSRLVLVAGERSRDKTVGVEGLTQSELKAALSPLMNSF